MTDEALEQQAGGAAAEPGADATPPADAPLGPADDTTPEALKAELARCQYRLLRTAAEFDNYRKRSERERRRFPGARGAQAGDQRP